MDMNFLKSTRASSLWSQIIFGFVSIPVMSIFLASCSAIPVTKTPYVIFITATEQGSTESIPVKATETPTLVVPIATNTSSYEDISSFEEFDQIEVTQGPVIVSTKYSPDNTYLYRNALVALQFTNSRLDGRRYLNLDNLNDNGTKNSDIIIDVSQGSGGEFFHFYPANYAKYYFSGENEMNYDSCVNQFPTNNVITIDDEQSSWLGTSKPYCVLTNEGHMAVVYFVQNSDLPNDQGVINFSLVVTVYQKKVLSIFTPAPTITPGPSPTPTNKYSVNGLSDEQAIELDNKVQEFINAAATRDKDSILDMLTYPLIVRIGLYDDYTIYNSQDFLAIYDQTFTDQFFAAVSKATVNDVQSGSLGLYINNGHEVIYFTKDGKIMEIDNYIDL
jgi:hypothetical protein